MKVYLSEYIYPEAEALLREHVEVVEDFDDVEHIDAIILRAAEVSRDIISKAKNLKVIGKHGVGCNTIDLEAAKEYNIPVVNTPLANTNSVAELIVGLMLNISRNISYCDAKDRKEGFSRIAPPEMTGIELTGKTVGLVGTGNIARRAGEILRNGFQVTLIGYDPYCSEEQAAKWGIKKYDDLKDMLEASDIVNVSVPLTKSTENMISTEEFEHFRKNAILINAARGGIVNEDALYTALKEKKLRAAACDAFVQEPPTGENKLMSLDNFCATPHIGANTEEALVRMGMEVVKEVLDVLDGKDPIHRVV
ncbi:MAG: hydroxyacid dehydrogenase [Clostridia bacterium]|nr:hydroxyacid dehydrogenase [Clostridia bacterium]NCC44285.1 hydroxyacid dehydrogenase [Clostridia bacterium]